MDQAPQRPNANSSAPGFKDGLQIYEKVGENLAGISQTPGNQAGYEPKGRALYPKTPSKSSGISEISGNSDRYEGA